MTPASLRRALVPARGHQGDLAVCGGASNVDGNVLFGASSLLRRPRRVHGRCATAAGRRPRLPGLLVRRIVTLAPGAPRSAAAAPPRRLRAPSPAAAARLAAGARLCSRIACRAWRALAWAVLARRDDVRRGVPSSSCPSPASAAGASTPSPGDSTKIARRTSCRAAGNSAAAGAAGSSASCAAARPRRPRRCARAAARSVVERVERRSDA